MNNKISTKSLVLASILTALSIILTRVLSIQVTESMRIGFGALPLIICGILLGPLLGGLAGFAADMIGVMINLGGAAIHLGFTLSSVLTGFIPGLIAILLYKKRESNSINVTIILSILLVYGLVHLLLNSLWLSGLYGTPFKVLVYSRALKVVLEGVLTGILLKIVFSKVISRSPVLTKF